MQELSINPPTRDIFSVSRLIREARAVLEGSFPLLWLEGEISNFSRPSSGHMYFSLKDEAAQVRCAMFRNRNLHLRFKPENGMHVLVRAKISLYEARGDFQIIIEHMEEAGLGALQRQFDLLKAKLGKEGLFDTSHKKTPPSPPKRLGIVTSPTGAAIRDILSVIKRRYPALPILVYPAAVQGEGAPDEICQAIELANQRNECDALIVARGGGSIEDLWAFNEEQVARAIFNSEIPVISGVGHEVDFTIADFVADRRAPTPSAAAEMITPDGETVNKHITQLYNRLRNQMRNTIKINENELQSLTKRLSGQHPGQRLQEKAQRLDELEQRLISRINYIQLQQHSRIENLKSRLHKKSPLNRLENLQMRYKHSAQRLLVNWKRLIAAKQHRLALSSRALNSISPLATLDRGYAIIQSSPEKKVIHRSTEVKTGDKVEARLSKGILICSVEEIKE